MLTSEGARLCGPPVQSESLELAPFVMAVMMTMVALCLEWCERTSHNKQRDEGEKTTSNFH